MLDTRPPMADLPSMDKRMKQRLTAQYIAVWSVGALLAVVFAGNGFVLVAPALWLWATFNIVQTWRGKRRSFWG